MSAPYHMSAPYRIEQVRIIDFETTKVAALEHRGDHDRIGDSLRQFIAWRKLHGLSPRTSDTFNILYDDPSRAEPARFRMDLCVSTPVAVAPNEFGIVGKAIPGGRCAVLRHTGSSETLGEALQFLCTVWLPQSGEELRDFPLFVQRLRFFPEVAEHDAVSDAFLPLKST